MILLKNMTTSNENENMDIYLTNEANNNGDGEIFSKDSSNAENKGGDGENSGGNTTTTVTSRKPSSWSEILQEYLIPEESKRSKTKDLTQLILRHPSFPTSQHG